MRKYPFLLLSISLLLFLGVPFILKLKDPRLEIYPAVIFPSGEGKVKTNQEQYKVFSIELYGYKNGLAKIDKKKFLQRVPVQYLYTIVEGNFGLEEYAEEFKLYKPPVKFTLRNNFSQETLKITKSWLRERLREQQMNDSAFVLRQYLNTYNVTTKLAESKEILDEKIFKLN